MTKRFAVLNTFGRVVNFGIAEAPLEPNWIELTEAHVGVQDGFAYDPESDTFAKAPETVEAESAAEAAAEAAAILAAAAAPRLITVNAWLKRWTDDEAVAIDLASIHVPSQALSSQHKAALLRRVLKLSDTATYINLRDPRVMAGVDLFLSVLNTAGVVSNTVLRKAQLLIDPTDEEKYTGPV